MEKLIGLIHQVKQNSTKGSFTRQENLHVTLAFLGETNAEKIDLIKACMDTSCLSDPLILTVKGIDRFHSVTGDLVFASVNPSKDLLDLQICLESELRKSGFPLEQRTFRPHITLGRNVVFSESFDKAKTKMEFEELNERIEKLVLMKSERIGGKLTYTPVYEAKLRDMTA